MPVTFLWDTNKTKPMDPEYKKKWPEALRSGEYKQGRTYLKVEFGFRTQHCCLGVICELIPEGKWKYEKVKTFELGFSSSNGCLPVSAAEIIGMDYKLGSFDCEVITTMLDEVGVDCYSVNKFENGYSSLVELNDNGFTFEEIADIIERLF